MLITHKHNAYNYKFTTWERERERFWGAQKVYILSLHTSNSKSLMLVFNLLLDLLLV